MFDRPYAVAVDGEGNIIVADYGNDRVRKIAVDGTVTTLAGSGVRGFLDGPGTAAMFDEPYGVAVDGEGNIIVADFFNQRVRKIDACLVPPSAVAASKGPMAPLATDLLRMLSSEKYADVTFSVDGQLIGAHRSVLCARSEYFATMLGSPFREGESAHGDRSASDEREGASPRRKRRATGIAEEDGGQRTGTRMDGTADRLLRVEDATAPAFRAVLHFLYSNEPLLEPLVLIDQMRCARRPIRWLAPWVGSVGRTPAHAPAGWRIVSSSSSCTARATASACGA
jgi:hypothetical protein